MKSSDSPGLRTGGALLLAGALAYGAIAPADASCGRGSYGRTDFTVSGPVRLSSRGIGVGEALSPWLDTIRTYSEPYDVVCATTDNIEFTVEGSAGPTEHYVESGIYYSVYPTAAPGVGVVVRARPTSNPGSAGGYEAGQRSILLRGTGHSYIFTASQVKFIKTAATVANGNMSRFQVGTAVATALNGGSRGTKPMFIEAATLQVVDQPSCRLNSQTVSMGTYSVGRFKGVGTGTTPVPYTVRLDCDAGVGLVHYQLNVVTPVYDEDQGVALVSGGATGVGIQFLDEGENPVAFYRTHVFGDIRNGESSRLFKARYQQIEPVIGPGEANASLTMIFTYP